ncbi:MAG: NAD-dependent epimerase/dehydratase family protein [Promethearchaeota archaeon]
MISIESKKILVTGGTGFLGSNIIRHLVNSIGIEPKNIRVFYLEGTPTHNLSNIKGLDFFQGNVVNFDSVNEAVKDIDIVWHVAGNTTFDPFKRRIQWLVNVEGTRNVLDACLKSDSVERIVYTSTVNTLGAPYPPGSFGDENTSPYDERTKSVHSFTSPEEILSFADAVHKDKAQKNWWKKIKVGYHNSKLAAQEMVNRAYRDHGLNVVSVLPGTFFGSGDAFVGPGIYILQVYNNSLPAYVETGNPLVHVLDVVQGHMLAMIKGRPGERYIITGRSEDNMYMQDMLKIIAAVIKEDEPERKIKTNWLKVGFRAAMLAARISELWARVTKSPCLLSTSAIIASRVISFYSCEKAKKELNYEPKFSFKEAVRDHLRYFKENGMLSLTGRLS